MRIFVLNFFLSIYILHCQIEGDEEESEADIVEIDSDDQGNQIIQIEIS